MGSPWDSLLSSGASTPPSPPGAFDCDLPKVYKVSLPKLVPEAEEGNVEYKLQLIEPSPERFLRLVTQLKWRLLEGGGQAYYELGVADSGQLVGLTRHNLDRSLETLEAMAGEIGASVVVVKEIEVPSSMFEPANRNVMLPKSKGMRNGHSRTKGREYSGKGYRSRPSDWGAVEIIRNSSATANNSDESSDASNSKGNSDGEGLKEEICLTVRVSPHPAIDGTPLSDLTPSPTSPVDDGIFNLDTEFHLFSALDIADRPRDPVHMPKKDTTKIAYNGSSLSRDGSPAHHSRRSSGKAVKVRPVKSMGVESKQVQESLCSLHVPLAGTTADSSSISGLNLTNNRPTSANEIGLQLATTAYTDTIPEPRLIVEALVVRKLSADEVFLDFGGFTLTD